MTELTGEHPKLEDGCVISSWKCSGQPIKCTTCNMIYCKEHMSRTEHLRDCHFRLSQEKDEMKKMQDRANEEADKLKSEAENNGKSDI